MQKAKKALMCQPQTLSHRNFYYQILTKYLLSLYSNGRASPSNKNKKYEKFVKKEKHCNLSFELFYYTKIKLKHTHSQPYA